MSDRAAARLSFQVLGPLRMWRDGVEVDPGPRQQAHLLALLLARCGRPVSAAELVDLLWDDEDLPRSALNIVHKYVGALRRVLEPELAPRSAGSYLHRRGNGYWFDTGGVTLDLTGFRRLVATARGQVTDRQDEAAVDTFERALAGWRGRVGDELAPSGRAAALFASLEEEFLTACAEAAEVAVRCGHPERVLEPLRLAARIAPFNETTQAALMTTLLAAGRPADALSVFRTVRSRLAEELGIDPGPTLRQAYRRVVPAPRATDVTGPIDSGPIDAGLVGRREEVAAVRRAVDSALGPQGQVVIVEGPPGVGKSRLLAEAASAARERDALPAWGHCRDGDGTPSLWPWLQVVGRLRGELPAGQRHRWPVGELDRLLDRADAGDPSGSGRPVALARFRLFEEIVTLLAAVATHRPLVLLLEDLHRADDASLQLFVHLAQRLPAGSALIGALRDRGPAHRPDHERMLAAVARLDRHRRIVLGPLDAPEVADLVRQETGHPPTEAVTRSIRARTDGNPLFVRELARFLADRGSRFEEVDTGSGVPSSVRDIVRDGMADLDDADRRLLRLAALGGRDLDVGRLARAAGLEVDQCLERLHAFQAVGLLDVTPGPPFTWRFAHDLVREAVVAAVPRMEGSRLHLRIADAWPRAGGAAEGQVEGQVEELAHHLDAAGPLADPARTAAAQVAAGRAAARRSAHQEALRHLDAAVRTARGAGLPELELAALADRTAVVGRVAGYVAAPSEHLERAEELARLLGHERQATDWLYARFLAYSQGIDAERSGRLARRLLDGGLRSPDPGPAACGRLAWGIHQWGLGNAGEARRYLTRSIALVPERRDDEPLQHDLQVLTPAVLALTTVLHGDVDTARELFDQVEREAGREPYPVTVWGGFAATAAALAGDPHWALRVADRFAELDPGCSVPFLGAFPRLARCWAQARLGPDPSAAADEAERIVGTMLAEPPRWQLATGLALLAETHLSAGRPAAAATALERAEAVVARHGERTAEAFGLLVRARWLRRRGEAESVVRAAAERALRTSLDQEAYLFTGRAEELLSGLR